MIEFETLSDVLKLICSENASFVLFQDIIFLYYAECIGMTKYKLIGDDSLPKSKKERGIKFFHSSLRFREDRVGKFIRYS